MKKLFLSIAILACAAAMAQDAVTTPGAINPNVTQDNIGKTICVSGWTKTVRPPVSYTNNLKAMQLHYGVYKSTGVMRDFEEDHRVPLEVGGHPTSKLNLWPEPWYGVNNAHTKDAIENDVHRRICAGKITLDEGRKVFLGDYFAWWNTHK